MLCCVMSSVETSHGNPTEKRCARCRYPFDIWAVTLRLVKTLLLGAASAQQIRDAAPVIQQQATALSARPVDAVGALLDGVWPQLAGTARRRISLCLTLLTALLEVRMPPCTTSPVCCLKFFQTTSQREHRHEPSGYRHQLHETLHNMFADST